MMSGWNWLETTTFKKIGAGVCENVLVRTTFKKIARTHMCIDDGVTNRVRMADMLVSNDEYFVFFFLL